jgi:hypothetical protein
MESVVVEVAHLNSVGQHFTAAIKNSNDFERIRCTGCSLHHQRIVGGIVKGASSGIKYFLDNIVVICIEG